MSVVRGERARALVHLAHQRAAARPKAQLLDAHASSSARDEVPVRRQGTAAQAKAACA